MPKKKSRKFRLDRRKKVLLGGFFVFLFAMFSSGAFLLFNWPTQAATKTWDGGGTDGTCGGGVGDGNKWSCAANWVGDVAPTSSDIAVFDATSTKNATVSLATTVAGIRINSGYTGTITQTATMTVYASGFEQSDGIYTQTNTMTLGFYDNTVPILPIASYVTINGGTYTQNGAMTIYGNTGFTMNNGTFNQNNTLTMSRAAISSSFPLLRYDSGGFTFNNGTFVHNGTFTIGTDGYTQNGSTFTGGLNKNITCEGPFALSTGTFSMPTGTGVLSIGGNFTVAGGTTFNFATTPLTFHDNSIQAVNSTISIPVGMTFTNLKISKTSKDFIVPEGDTLEVTGTLTLATSGGDIDGGTVEASGTLVFTSGANYNGSTGTVQLTGSTVQTVTINGTAPGFINDNPNATISAGVFSGNVIMNAGILNGMATATTVNGSLTLNPGSVFNAGSAETTVSRNWINNGGTFNHGGGTVTFQNFDSYPGFVNEYTVYGDNTFYNFRSKDPGSYDYIGFIKFEAGKTQTILNEARMILTHPDRPDFVHGTRYPISSTVPGVAANLDLQGDVTMWNVQLTDINNMGTAYDCRLRCADNGGNTGFDFSENVDVYVSEISGETNEDGGTAAFTVYFTGQPSSDITIPVTSLDASEGAASTSELTFTHANWETKQTVTVTGQDDADNDGIVSYTIQLGTTVSADPLFNGLNPDDVSVKNADNDSASTAFEFERLSDYDQEDVKGTLTVPIGGLLPWWAGMVEFVDNYTDQNPIDFSLASKVQPGCKIDISTAANPYTLTRFADYGTSDYDYNAYLVRENVIPWEFDVTNELYDLEGDITIDSITCLESQDGGIKLNDEYITVQTWPETDVDEIITDTTGDRIFYVDGYYYDMGRVNIVDVATGATITTDVGEFPTSLAYDSSRDILWVGNEYEGTVTLVDADTGNYHNGTYANSTYVTAGSPNFMLYDAVNDAVWVEYYASPDGYMQFDASDPTQTVTLPVSAADDYIVRGGLTYDSAHDKIWASVATSFPYYHYLVEIDAATAQFANGTFLDSIHDNPMIYRWTDGLAYDAERDLLWDAQDYYNGQIGLITATRASDAEPIEIYEVDLNPLDIYFNGGSDEIWSLDSSGSTISIVDADTGRLKKVEPVASEDTANFTLDGDGAIWMGSENEYDLTKIIPDGVATDEYYTFTSNAASQIDTTGQTGISAAAVTETLNGQNIFYAVSFDGRNSFKVWGSWRAIASNKAADHGGVEGDWYWRDNANVWTAATPNDKNAAISAAVAAGANNQMTGTEMAALGEADWEAAGGFESGVTTTLDLAATLYTDDPQASPSVGKVDFTLLGEEAEPPPPTAPYTSTTVVMSRLKDPTPTTVDLYFSMTNPLLEGTVITTTFEGGAWSSFTAPTGGTGLGTAPSFGTTGSGFTVTCGVGGCGPGAVTVTGGGASTPASPGSYTVAITNDQNDDVAYAAVAVVDDDTVTLNAAIDPYLTFDIDIGTSATPGANDSSAPYLISLGHFSGDVTHGSGADSVPYIEIDLATNALLGVTVTIADTDATRTLRSGSDDFGSVLSNTALAGAVNGYGLCIVNADGLTMSGNYDGDGSNDGCTATGGGDDVVTTPAAAGSPETFLSTTSTLTSEANPIIAVKGRSSYLNPAHVDYSTSVRFIATATF